MRAESEFANGSHLCLMTCVLNVQRSDNQISLMLGRGDCDIIVYITCDS